MEYMLQPGFFGTRAPLFVDIMTLLMAILPFLLAGAIHMAKLKKYGLHMALNIALFFVALFVIGYFEYGVVLAGAYDTGHNGSTSFPRYLIAILVLHLVIAMITLAMWANILYNASKHFQNGLPGPRSKRHRKAGLRVFVGVILTALTGIWIYLLLFVY